MSYTSSLAFILPASFPHPSIRHVILPIHLKVWRFHLVSLIAPFANSPIPLVRLDEPSFNLSVPVTRLLNLPKAEKFHLIIASSHLLTDQAHLPNYCCLR